MSLRYAKKKKWSVSHFDLCHAAFFPVLCTVTYHTTVADKGLSKVDGLFIDQLAESSNLSNLLDDQDRVFIVTISSNTYKERKGGGV